MKHKFNSHTAQLAGRRSAESKRLRREQARDIPAGIRNIFAEAMFNKKIPFRDRLRAAIAYSQIQPGTLAGEYEPDLDPALDAGLALLPPATGAAPGRAPQLRLKGDAREPIQASGAVTRKLRVAAPDAPQNQIESNTEVAATDAVGTNMEAESETKLPVVP